MRPASGTRPCLVARGHACRTHKAMPGTWHEAVLVAHGHACSLARGRALTAV
jgi:hypothetical protein